MDERLPTFRRQSEAEREETRARSLAEGVGRAREARWKIDQFAARLEKATSGDPDANSPAPPQGVGGVEPTPLDAAEIALEHIDDHGVLATVVTRLDVDGGDDVGGMSSEESEQEIRAFLVRSSLPESDPPPPKTSVSSTETPAIAAGAERTGLTHNPRKLRHWRNVTIQACASLHEANHHARKDSLEKLIVPRKVFQLMHDVFDDTNAVAGVIDWVRRTHGGGVMHEVVAAALYRERGGVQIDDWSRPRARRKLALLVFLLMSPHLLKRSEVTGSTSDEELLVTAGVPQTLLVKLLRSSQREPYCPRTLQRDLAEIEACTDLLLRWKTPVAHAQPWEKQGNEHGVVNRYCVRAGMIRDQWRRATDATHAMLKGFMLRAASWMVWQPAPPRGSPVAFESGGFLTPDAAPS